MKMLVTIVLLGLLVLTIGSPVLAADLSNGAQVFSANCAACHVKGGNLVNASKTLKKDVLDKNAMASLDAITTQVKNGKNAMPAFAGRLNAKQIEDVASYVLDQAEKGWS